MRLGAREPSKRRFGRFRCCFMSMSIWGRVLVGTVSLALLVSVANSIEAEDLADEVCKNFQEFDDSFPYEEYKVDEVRDVWKECYGAPPLGDCACFPDGCCDFSAAFDLDCSGSCRRATLNAIHERCWYRFDIDEDPPKPEQCEGGNATLCEPAYYAFRKAVDKARRECLKPQWGFIFLLIFSGMGGAMITLAAIGYVTKLYEDRKDRQKSE